MMCAHAQGTAAPLAPKVHVTKSVICVPSRFEAAAAAGAQRQVCMSCRRTCTSAACSGGAQTLLDASVHTGLHDLYVLTNTACFGGLIRAINLAIMDPGSMHRGSAQVPGEHLHGRLGRILGVLAKGGVKVLRRGVLPDQLRELPCPPQLLHLSRACTGCNARHEHTIFT